MPSTRWPRAWTRPKILRKNLIADVSHELRTPLTVVQGDLQAILDGVYPLEMAQVASLYDETRLLTRLVDDLHDLALADAGQLRIERLPVDLAELAQAAVGAVRAAGRGRPRSALRFEARRTGARRRRRGPDIAGAAQPAEQRLRHTPAGGQVTVRVRAHGRPGRSAGGRHAARASRPRTCRTSSTGSTAAIAAARGRAAAPGLGLAIARQLVAGPRRRDLRGERGWASAPRLRSSCPNSPKMGREVCHLSRRWLHQTSLSTRHA